MKKAIFGSLILFSSCGKTLDHVAKLAAADYEKEITIHMKEISVLRLSEFSKDLEKYRVVSARAADEDSYLTVKPSREINSALEIECKEEGHTTALIYADDWDTKTDRPRKVLKVGVHCVSPDLKDSDVALEVGEVKRLDPLPEKIESVDVADTKIVYANQILPDLKQVKLIGQKAGSSKVTITFKDGSTKSLKVGVAKYVPKSSTSK